MLRALSIVFACALGSSIGFQRNGNRDCPARYTERLMECVEPMQRLRTNPPRNMQATCRIANRGLDCVADIMERCSNQEDIALMADMLNMNQTRALIDSQCSGTPMPTFTPGRNSNCPPGFEQRILDCVEPLQNHGQVTTQNIVESCRVAVPAIECFDTILTNCAGEPQVQALTSMLDVSSMRTMVESQCAAIGSNNNNNGNCPSDYAQRMMECVEPMQHIDVIAAQNVELACSMATDGFGCIEFLITNCRHTPEIQSLTSIMDVNEMRSLVDAECAAYGSGGNDNCPVGYEGRLMECLEPMQNLDEMAAEDEALACSVATDGFGCLDNIISNCGNKPAVQRLTNIIDVDEMRSMVDLACSGNAANTCDVASPTQELQRCNGMLSAIQDQSRPLRARCRELNRGFECFLDLISRCPEDPAVSAFTSVIDIGDARQSMTIYCQ